MKKSLALLLLVACGLNACASKSTRQERAYAKYVRNSSIVHQKQRGLFRHSDKPQMPTMPMPTEPSEPIETTETGPQAVPSGESSGL